MAQKRRKTNGDFFLLPDDCISKVISFLGPLNACRLSTVSPIFRPVAESDAVWDYFLPCDYQALINRSRSPTSLYYRSKKELYLILSQCPLLIDGGTKTFFLDKQTGKKCYRLSAKNLLIDSGKIPGCWKWTHLAESSFSEIAELVQVRRIDVRGKINTAMLSKGTHYVAYLVFRKTDDISGFINYPMRATVGVVGGVKSCKRRVYLVSEQTNFFRRQYRSRLEAEINVLQARAEEVEMRHMQVRGDAWVEVELGEFFNNEAEDGEVEMSIMEMMDSHWKKGVIIEGIEIRPKTKRWSNDKAIMSS